MELRSTVYRHLVDHGAAPSRQHLTELVGDVEETDALLAELHDRHLLVLDDRDGRVGNIRMALPFSNDPTDFVVTTDSGRWWANCAWDSLAILAALRIDGRITSTWSDTGRPVGLAVSDGRLVDARGSIHFAVPAARWWDGIVVT